MKRYFSIFVIALCTLTVFNACSDVPAPYKIPGEEGPGTGGSSEGTYIDETFKEDFGGFTDYTEKGNPWIIDFKTAKATGYDNASKTTTESKGWLISEAFDLSQSTGAYVEFEYILRYVRAGQTENKVLISTEYFGDVNAAKWIDITGTLTEGSDWDTFYKYTKDLPAEVIGKNHVNIALYYACTTTSATWEVKNISVKEGSVKPEEEDKEDEKPDSPTQPVSGNLLENGDAETWDGSLPSHWKSASTASSATLSQSTDAHSGSYSICVVGATTNKRLAYEEITLKAGTYTLTFYAKAATADGGSIRPGYTSVIDGVAQSNGYKYGSYSDNLTNTEWREITHEFTLESTTTLCLVFMNPKQTGKDVLLDDFSLTTANGGLADGSNDDENDDENDTPTASITYTKVTTISAGTYIIAANVDGTYKVATPLGATANYGYLKNPVDATENNNTITLSSAANEFVIESTSGGYTIKDGNDKYYYMTGTYNSFNVGTSLPAEGGVWNITFNADGTANLVNTTMNKTLQYDTEFGSYGVYDTIKATLPALYKKN